MRTNQAGIAFVNLGSSYLGSWGLVSTVSTDFAIRIIVILVNYMKNFLHNQGVTATN